MAKDETGTKKGSFETVPEDPRMILEQALATFEAVQESLEALDSKIEQAIEGIEELAETVQELADRVEEEIFNREYPGLEES